MIEQSIACPHCGKKIPLTEALTHPIEEKLRKEFASESKKSEHEHEAAIEALRKENAQKLADERVAIEKAARKRVEDALGQDMKDLKSELAEKAKLLDEARRDELAMRKREREIEERENTLKLETQRTLDKERSKIREEAAAKALGERQIELDDLKTQLEDRTKRLDEAQQRELMLRKREREIDERENALKVETQRTLDKERLKIREEAIAQALGERQIELEDLKAQLEERTKKLDTAQQQELALRKQQRELEERERSMNLELERRLDEERVKVREDALAKAAEDHHLRDREKDKQLDDMRKQIEDLKRKAEQGSQQSQGEVQELELEEILRSNFRFDEIEPVAKGVRGADVLQRVCSSSGKSHGSILWESKRTKAWSDGWLQKLKDDQREAKADIGIIVSAILPKGINHIGCVEGVWVTDVPSLVGLGTALRAGISQLAHVQDAMAGKGEKMELIYRYLSGPEFRHRVEAIVEAFVAMKTDLDSEKRAMERTWAKREKQIQRVIHNTSGMYGDLQGLIGSSLSPIPSLEMSPVQPSDSKEHPDEVS
ncbi:MAG: DUF2130 domain-containing protein [Elusimicrobia bacterium]|nr:DUF2130 domain-containing protein [Elusimicrobiota bacterium]